MAGTRSMGNTLTMKMAGTETEDTVLGNIVSIGELSTETDEIETTTLDSPNGAKEFIQGAKDSGELSIELNNVYDGTVEALNSVFDAGETRDWTIGFVDSDGTTQKATLDFGAFVKGRAYGESTPEGLDKVTFTLRVSGAPVYAEV